MMTLRKNQKRRILSNDGFFFRFMPAFIREILKQEDLIWFRSRVASDWPTFDLLYADTDAPENIAVKSDNTEINIERSACEDYLDLYATELIYCLEQIADKVDRTVVFEDMDRLNQKDCIEVFSRLREINYMLNQRLQGENMFVLYMWLRMRFWMSYSMRSSLIIYFQ